MEIDIGFYFFFTIEILVKKQSNSACLIFQIIFIATNTWSISDQYFINLYQCIGIFYYQFWRLGYDIICKIELHIYSGSWLFSGNLETYLMVRSITLWLIQLLCWCLWLEVQMVQINILLRIHETPDGVWKLQKHWFYDR